MPLTDREEKIFNFIFEYVLKNHCSPTRQEIADKFKVGISMAQKYTRILELKGRIKIIKEEGKRLTRNISIVKQTGR